jgi:hypothetical protein
MNGPFLRALTIGELLDKAFLIYRRRFLLFIGMTAMVLIPDAIMRLLAVQGSINTLLESVISLVFIRPFATVVLIGAISNTYLNQEASFRSILSKSRYRYWSVVLSRFLILIGVIFPMLFLAACVATALLRSQTSLIMILSLPFIFFLLAKWSIANEAIVLEDVGASVGLRRSWNLTTFYFWRVFGTSFAAWLLDLLLAELPLLFANYVFNILNVPLEISQVVKITIGQLTSLIIMPFSTAVAVLIYYDLRIRKEGFDLLVRANEIVTPTQPKPTA